MAVIEFCGFPAYRVFADLVPCVACVHVVQQQKYHHCRQRPTVATARAHLSMICGCVQWQVATCTPTSVLTLARLGRGVLLLFWVGVPRALPSGVIFNYIVSVPAAMVHQLQSGGKPTRGARRKFLVSSLSMQYSTIILYNSTSRTKYRIVGKVCHSRLQKWK